jgi:hypothetical protein
MIDAQGDDKCQLSMRFVPCPVTLEIYEDGSPDPSGDVTILQGAAAILQAAHPDGSGEAVSKYLLC